MGLWAAGSALLSGMELGRNAYSSVDPETSQNGAENVAWLPSYLHNEASPQGTKRDEASYQLAVRWAAWWFKILLMQMKKVTKTDYTVFDNVRWLKEKGIDSHKINSLKIIVFKKRIK